MVGNQFLYSLLGVLYDQCFTWELPVYEFTVSGTEHSEREPIESKEDWAAEKEDYKAMVSLSYSEWAIYIQVKKTFAMYI